MIRFVRIAALSAALAITSACGYGSKNYTATPNANPAIAQLNPDSAAAGGAEFTFNVTGSNFATKATINWNGTAMATTYVSGGALSTTIPATQIVASGTAAITVTNPATTGTGMYGGGTPAVTSAPMTFTIN